MHETSKNESVKTGDLQDEKEDDDEDDDDNDDEADDDPWR